MEKIVIDGKSGLSAILVGESLEKVDQYISSSTVFIISDKNVVAAHGKSFPTWPVYTLEPGEQSKDFSVIAEIWKWLLDNGADRSSFILGIGGGVVCDIAGFVASTFMRGVPFGFVASSLLAQVDASVGGKNGINLHGYKNIVGTFSQPSFVICDTNLLQTLPDDEFRNGLAEIIKHAAIRDRSKFDFLSENKEQVLGRNPMVINELVARSVKIKAAVVQADELEKGERRLLNFGHTWGHAIEKVTHMPHGQAVAIGMDFAARLSVELGYLDVAGLDALIALIREYGLPVKSDANPVTVYEAMLKDKKRYRTSMHFILLKSVGEAFVKEIDVETLKKFAL